MHKWYTTLWTIYPPELQDSAALTSCVIFSSPSCRQPRAIYRFAFLLSSLTTALPFVFYTLPVFPSSHRSFIMHTAREEKDCLTTDLTCCNASFQLAKNQATQRTLTMYIGLQKNTRDKT